MTEGQFTAEEAENDGLFKSEIRDSVKSTASRSGGEIFDYYMEWCEINGIDPGVDLADACIRALNDETFAERILNTQMELADVKMGNYREEDFEFLMRMKEEYSGLFDSGLNLNVEDIVEQRLNGGSGVMGGGQSQNPFDMAAQGSQQDDNQKVERLEREVQELKRELKRERSQDTNSGGGGSVPTDSGGSGQMTRSGPPNNTEDREEAVEGLFGDESQDGGAEEVEVGGDEVVQEEEVEVVDLDQEDSDHETKTPPGATASSDEEVVEDE